MSQKYSQMPIAGPLDGTELFCISQAGTSVRNNLSNLVNNNNLIFDGGFLTTVQDIDVDATVFFRNITAQHNLAIVRNDGGTPQIITDRDALPTILPQTILEMQFNAFDSAGVSNLYFDWNFLQTNTDPVNSAGAFRMRAKEGAQGIQLFQEWDGNTSTITQFKRLENLVGYQSFTEQFILSASQNVTDDIIGRCAISNVGSDIVLTIPQNDTFSINAEFEVLRNGAGNLTVQAGAGVSLNGVVNGSYQLPEQYDRAIVRKIAVNEYVYTAFSADSGTTQEPVFAEMYFQGNTSGTVPLVIGVPVKVNATYLAGNIAPDFTFSNGELTYTGVNDITVLIQANLTASMALNTATVTPSIAVNGVVVDKSKQSTGLVGVSPNFESMSVSAIVTLSTNDAVSLYIANETNTDDIFVQDLNTFSITAIGSISGSGTGTGISGDFQLGACLVPTTSYGPSENDYTSVINQLSGTQTIEPGSLAIGESVQIRATFSLYPTCPNNTNTTAGQFKLIFGSTEIATQANLVLTNNASRSGWFEYTITRTSQNEVQFDFYGLYTYTNPVEPRVIIGSPSLIAPLTLAYDDTQSYLMDVQWAYTIGPLPDYYLDCVVNNLIINQYTARRSAGTGSQVVQTWDGSTTPVNVTAGSDIDIANGVISYTGTTQANVVTSWDGSTTPVAVTAGTGISIAGGTITATGATSNDNTSFFTTLLPSDNYVTGVYTPVWFTNAGNNQIDANTWAIGDTFEINIVGEFVTRQQVPDSTTGSFFRLTVGSNQILSNDLDVPLINDGAVRVKPFNFKIMFTRIDDIASQPTWTVSGNGFFTDLSDNFKPIALQTSTLYNIDVTINNIINLEYQQNHSVNNTYDFQCVQLNMRKYTV